MAKSDLQRLANDTIKWKTRCLVAEQRVREDQTALKLALATLEEIEHDGWSIRQECGLEDCLICPRKKAARDRALAAMTALRKALK